MCNCKFDNVACYRNLAGICVITNKFQPHCVDTVALLLKELYLQYRNLKHIVRGTRTFNFFLRTYCRKFQNKLQCQYDGDK